LEISVTHKLNRVIKLEVLRGMRVPQQKSKNKETNRVAGESETSHNNISHPRINKSGQETNQRNGKEINEEEDSKAHHERALDRIVLRSIGRECSVSIPKSEHKADGNDEIIENTHTLRETIHRSRIESSTLNQECNDIEETEDTNEAQNNFALSKVGLGDSPTLGEQHEQQNECNVHGNIQDLADQVKAGGSNTVAREGDKVNKVKEGAHKGNHNHRIKEGINRMLICKSSSSLLEVENIGDDQENVENEVEDIKGVQTELIHTKFAAPRGCFAGEVQLIVEFTETVAVTNSDIVETTTHATLGFESDGLQHLAIRAEGSSLNLRRVEFVFARH